MRIPRERWLQDMALASAIVAVGALPLSMTGAMAVQIGDSLNFGEQRLGAIYATFFAVAAVSSVLVGSLTERVGARWALRAGTLLAAAVFLATAAFARSWATLTLVMAVGGVATAFARPAANLWLTQVIPVRRQGLAFGIKNTSIPIATIVAGMSVPFIALTIGWRWGFVLGAVLALGIALRIPQPTATRRSAVALDDGGDLPRTLLVLLGLGMACGAIGSSSLNAFTVVSVVDAGVSEGAAGFLFAIASVAGIVSRVYVGHRADQRDAGHLRVVALMLLVGALGYAVFAVRHPVAAFVAAPVTFATGWGWIGLFNLAVVRMNPGAPAAATGVTQAGAFVGGVVGPLGLGTLAERTSFTVAWLLAAVLATVGALVLLAIRRRVRGRGSMSRTRGEAGTWTGVLEPDDGSAP